MPENNFRNNRCAGPARTDKYYGLLQVFHHINLKDVAMHVIQTGMATISKDYIYNQLSVSGNILCNKGFFSTFCSSW